MINKYNNYIYVANPGTIGDKPKLQLQLLNYRNIKNEHKLTYVTHLIYDTVHHRKYYSHQFSILSMKAHLE